MRFLASAFSELDGSPSSMRLLSGIVVIAWCVVFLRAGWMDARFPDLTVEHLGILAIPFGAKAWQKGKEVGEPIKKEST